MASAIDEDTARTLASGRETVGGMLSAAQGHLKKIFLVFVAAMMGTIWALRAFLWDKLKADLLFARMEIATREATEIVAVTPFDVILLQIKVGLIAGAIAALPVTVWYSRDALKARGYWPSSEIPAWKIYAVGVFIGLLFAAGVSYAYFLFFPIMFDFLAANALQSGFQPTYSIVMWTEFMLFLTLSFGLAAQLPLAMSAMARAGIVPYETFREKWRYAVVGIFVFGAMFSPPDPFTQVMWGVPLVALYVVSLGVTKLAVTSKRAGEQVPAGELARERWNHLAGSFLVAGVAVYAYLTEGGLEATSRLLAAVGSAYRAPATGDLAAFGVSHDVVSALIGAVVGLVAAGVVLFYFRITELDRLAREASAAATAAPETSIQEETAEPGEPAEIDIGAMNARAIEAAPTEAFLELSEERALEYAEGAVENDEPEKARAVLDRFDDARELREQQAAETKEEPDPVTSTAAGMLDPFTEEETTEEDIGGYYYDLAFILDSLTSKTIWIAGVFMAVLAGSFLFLYQGGIRDVTEAFLGGLPPQMVEDVVIVTLHPVEALIFMIKFSTLLAAVSIVPILLYFAWPAVETRGVATGDRNVLLLWGGTLFVSLGGGSLLGFLYIAPTILSWLAFDAITSNMVIAYRINNFGWLVIYLTVGVGMLALIPATMVLFHYGDIVRYRAMHRRWRPVVLSFFAAAGFLSPKGIFTMFLVGIPASLAYGAGLGLLWLATRVGGATPERRSEAAD